MKNKSIKPFLFKQFKIYHDHCAMKVGTDGVLLGAWTYLATDNQVLDIGTGSGLIAIMTAQKNTTAQIIGIEIDEAAALQAQENAKNSPWKNRLNIQHISLQEFVIKNNIIFDHIISNPPFFKKGTSTKSAERNQARQTYTLTFEDIILSAKKLLSLSGKISVILPPLEAELFISIANRNNFYLNRQLNIKPKKEKSIERVLMEFSQKKIAEIEIKELIIQHEQRNDWTDDYIQLTGDFYLKM
jgi:tRNA1Val (adenine37-N6)-methyltransferase